MDGLCRVSGSGLDVHAACSRCEAIGCPWDRIGGKAICPDCQELLALGVCDPLVERLVPNCCAICTRRGTAPYLTFPLHANDPLALDLCPQHFRALLGRRLDRRSFRTLAKLLRGLGLTEQQVFLLHQAFYDEDGRSLQPVEW
jgi:hypothetical protein